MKCRTHKKVGKKKKRKKIEEQFAKDIKANNNNKPHQKHQKQRAARWLGRWRIISAKHLNGKQGQLEKPN